MIVTEKALLRAATILEANAHRAGWDATPAQIVALAGAGRTVVAAQRPAVLPGGRPPGELLTQIAVRMWVAPDPPAAPVKAALFVGWAFLCEAWMAKDMTEQEMRDYDAGVVPGGLADRIGSVEMRMCVATDTTGRVVAANRIRGQAPMTNMGDVAQDDSVPKSWQGRVPAALRLMTLALCRQLPADAHTFGALPELEVRGDNLCEALLNGDTVHFPA